MSKNIRVFVSILYFLTTTIGFANNAKELNSLPEVAKTEHMVAKGDGIHDDTKAIQISLDSLSSRGGGVVSLEAGVYLVSTLRLGAKTSLIGSGNGATIIKQKENCKEGCLIIPSYAAAFKISDLTLLGNDKNAGILVENSVTNSENHSYLYTTNTPNPQPYKWITIDNICIYHFGTGIQIERWGWDINICNSTISFNTNGVDMKCTDSSIYNCYITNNRKNGLIVGGSNNRVNNIKSIWNGREDGVNSSAIIINGSRNLFSNCETQDNYCSGYQVNGQYNLLSNCFSNTDGYAKKSRQYDPEVRACGFKIKGLYNSFSNCAVTSYTDKYGAVFHSPVWVDSASAYYYPDIFNDIKVLIAKDKALFHEPFRNVQTLASKNKVSSNGIIKKIDCPLNSLGLLVDFKSTGDIGNVFHISGSESMGVSLKNHSVFISWNGVSKAKLGLDDHAVFDQDDVRLIISFYQKGKAMAVSMLMYEKTANKGWIKKEIQQDTDIPATMIKGAEVKLGDQSVVIKRIALCNNPIPESVFLPSSNTNRIYDASFVYVDKDAPLN